MAIDRIAHHWWPLALSEEVTRDRPLARSCRGHDYVLFRDKNGIACALEDRCRHRRVPLSLGRVTEHGFVQCGYHGWTFEGTTGRCRVIPNLRPDERIPASYKAACFATSEQNGVVYVWTGKPESARSLYVSAVQRSERFHEAIGSKLLSIPHATFVGALLDGPHTIVDIPGIKILAQRFGDPQLRDGMAEAEFVCDWTDPPKREGCFLDEGIIPDYPFVAHIAAEATTGQARLKLVQDERKIILSVGINSAPVRESVTAVQWRCVISDDAPKIGAIEIVDHVDAAKLVALGTEGLSLWRSAEVFPVQPAMATAFEDVKAEFARSDRLGELT